MSSVKKQIVNNILEEIYSEVKKQYFSAALDVWDALDFQTLTDIRRAHLDCITLYSRYDILTLNKPRL